RENSPAHADRRLVSPRRPAPFRELRSQLTEGQARPRWRVPTIFAPLAQLDRASDFESEGRRFESYGVRQPSAELSKRAERRARARCRLVLPGRLEPECNRRKRSERARSRSPRIARRTTT